MLVPAALAAPTAHAASSSTEQRHWLEPGAGWHGRRITQPQRESAARAALPTTLPSGWSAGPARPGTGYANRHGSKRVREVQRALRRLGYRPGPIDGRFGPRTRAAVGWFQTKHELPVTGIVNGLVLRLMRRRVGSGPAPVRPRSTPGTNPSPQQAPASTTPAQPRGSRSSGTGLGSLLLIAAAVVAVLAAMSGFALVGRKRREEDDEPGLAPVVTAHPGEQAALEPAAVADAEPEPARQVLGYVSFAEEQNGNGHELAAYADDIQALCRRRGWHLVQVVRELERPGKRTDRPGLTYALRRIADGNAEALVVAKLSHLARSVAELGPLLDWFGRSGVPLVAIDLRLDTTSSAGQLMTRALSFASDWERERISERTRQGLEAARARRSSGGRSAVSDRPDLQRRIANMRADGMSLQAIADTLNAEGVPTLRGGAHWRPSSVQAAAGYKRPRAGRPAPDLPSLPDAPAGDEQPSEPGEGR